MVRDVNDWLQPSVFPLIGHRSWHLGRDHQGCQVKKMRKAISVDLKKTPRKGKFVANFLPYEKFHMILLVFYNYKGNIIFKMAK